MITITISTGRVIFRVRSPVTTQMNCLVKKKGTAAVIKKIAL